MSFFLEHSIQRWATVLFRSLWLLLVVFVVCTGFTVYTIVFACVELYRQAPTISFVPGILLGVVSLSFAGWALFMVAKAAFWRIEAEMYRRDAISRQEDLLKRQISMQARSV